MSTSALEEAWHDRLSSPCKLFDAAQMLVAAASLRIRMTSGQCNDINDRYCFFMDNIMILRTPRLSHLLELVSLFLLTAKNDFPMT